MADISHSLMIRFGTSRQPTAAETNQWIQLTEALIRQGVSSKEAGQRAAAQVLPGTGTRVFASQADTIEMLLSKAKEK